MTGREDIRRLLPLAAALVAASLPAAEYYVCHETGDDFGKGTIDRPFRTFHKALETLQGGDTLHILPTKEPYTEKFGNLRLNSHYDGTPEKPTIIEGHGSRLCAMVRYPLGGWTDMGGGVWMARPPHNVVCMAGRGYYDWKPFVKVKVDNGWKWFAPVPDKANLQPYEMYWCFKAYRERNWEKDPDFGALYLRLPDGMTPETNEIHLPQKDNLIIGADYCIVRDLDFEWSTADCIDTERTKGSVIENVSIQHCLDQCISAHSTAGLLVRYSYFADALCGNVLDIPLGKDQHCFVRYYGCVFGEGTGVRFIGSGENSRYEVESCLIRDQYDKGAVTSLREVEVTVRNCQTPGCLRGVEIETTGVILAEDCDFSGAKEAFAVWAKELAPNQLVFRRCVFGGGQKMIVGGSQVTPEEAAAAGVVFEDCSFDGPRAGVGFRMPDDPRVRATFARFAGYGAGEGVAE